MGAPASRSGDCSSVLQTPCRNGADPRPIRLTVEIHKQNQWGQIYGVKLTIDTISSLVLARRCYGYAMRTLFHMPLDPASRMIRIILAEKGLPVQLVEKRPWEDEDGSLSAMNPAGTVPVLVDEPPTGGELAVTPALAIVEYLEEAYGALPLLPSTSAARAETRRLCAWFMDKFDAEVSDFTLRETIDRRLMRRGQPDYERLKAGGGALAWHLDYAAWLLEQRHWFAGERYTLADIAAAAQFSALDYIDLVPWDKFPGVKDWYARIKSRPALRPILRDRMEGLPPPAHYDDPDF